MEFTAYVDEFPDGPGDDAVFHGVVIYVAGEFRAADRVIPHFAGPVERVHDEGIADDCETEPGCGDTERAGKLVELIYGLYRDTVFLKNSIASAPCVETRLEQDERLIVHQSHIVEIADILIQGFARSDILMCVCESGQLSIELVLNRHCDQEMLGAEIVTLHSVIFRQIVYYDLKLSGVELIDEVAALVLIQTQVDQRMPLGIHGEDLRYYVRHVQGVAAQRDAS